MSWSARHEGSPRAVDGLTPGQLAQGLMDGAWEPTDEVMGPDDTRWVAFESHPVFADVCLDLEPPPARTYDDETRLDMTPLIDVCLVLLIFFILTTTYAAIQKMLDLPGMTAEGLGPRVVTKEQVDSYMIRAEVRMEKVDRAALVPALARYRLEKKKTELLLDHSPTVPHGAVVAVQDAAKGAEIQKVHILVPKEEMPR
jgi:biopolymer transport protein ExbD